MLIAFDTETSALHPDDGGTVVCLSIAWRQRDGALKSRAYATPWSSPDWPRISTQKWRELAEWMIHPEHQLVAHNAKFDLMHLAAATRGLLTHNPWAKEGEIQYRPLVEAWVEQTQWDTMLAAKILDGQASAALKETAKRLWGAEETTDADDLAAWFVKKRQKTNPRYDQVPWPLLSRYARRDCELTLRLFEYQVACLEEEPDEQPLIEREFAFSRVILSMERRGIAFRKQEAEKAADWLRIEIERAAADLPFRPTIPAAKRYFFDEQKLRPKNVTKGGAAALRERDLDQLAKQDVPGAKAFNRHQALSSMLAKWYGPWPRLCGEDSRLRPTFNLVRVRSARLSVERVQLQAIPHRRHFEELGVADEIPLPRELFHAKKGYELWEIDLAQGEVRIAAAAANCPAMQEIIDDPNSDVHGETCRRIFGIDPTAPDWKAKRDVAKRITFGVLYGAGPRTLAETVFREVGIKIAETEMKGMIDSYKSVFPEFFSHAKEIERSCRRFGYVALISGKKRYFQFGPPLFEEARKAFNAEIQGGLAETMRDVMLQVETQLPGRLLLQIHDSIVLELPRKTAQDEAEFARRLMVLVYELQWKVTFQAEAGKWEDKS